MKCLLILLTLFLSVPSFAQRPDSLNAETVKGAWRYKHSPRKAALFSALLPGAGQVYNRKFWKVPIVWGAIGVTYYYGRFNHDKYLMYRDAYLAITDGDPGTVDPFNGEFPASFVEQNVDFHRRYRDMSYIGFGLMYILNIVDASIDGHFVRFDVGDDLEVAFAPSYQFDGSMVPSIGIAIAPKR